MYLKYLLQVSDLITTVNGKHENIVRWYFTLVSMKVFLKVIFKQIVVTCASSICKGHRGILGKFI